ncbi:hypothetical protein TTRE_0000340501 [Trichuris trichiura]|uniref:Uncharacterized protein n=1 Tax=Trichuris trichiura TaxID=36087 RepID=A0A077Z5S0_TRITR|nr:hypothetical protein TTRE_0000340501 [Trichuris trichiura]
MIVSVVLASASVVGYLVARRLFVAADSGCLWGILKGGKMTQLSDSSCGSTADLGCLWGILKGGKMAQLSDSSCGTTADSACLSGISKGTFHFFISIKRYHHSNAQTTRNRYSVGKNEQLHMEQARRVLGV